MQPYKAIITGHTCAIGQAIKAHLEGGDWTNWKVEGWSRSTGVDLLLGDLPEVTECDLVVHVAETGIGGLSRVWNRTHAALTQSHGAFIGISSISAVQDTNVYAQSKQSQEHMLRHFAHTEPRIRVNCLRLGHVIGTRHWPDGSAITDQKLNRFVRPSDVAEAVIFLAHALSITGQVLTIDAGSTL